jgi:hypothetical protein
VCLFVCELWEEEREKINEKRHFLIYSYFLFYVSEMTFVSSNIVFITQTKASSSSGASSASRIPKLAASLLSRSRTTTSVIIKRRQKRNESFLYSTTTSLTTTTTTSASHSSTLPRLLSLQKHTLVDDGEGGSFVFSSRRLLFSNAGKASSSSSSSSSTSSSKKKRSQNKRSHNKKTIKCESETRIASVLTSLPQRLDLYFQRRSYRMLLWKTIFIFVGFYLASVITLSFGALGINDVVAGALCVFVYETITRWYYKTSRPGRKLEFVNCFKLGLVYSLIADAFKLGS